MLELNKVVLWFWIQMKLAELLFHTCSFLENCKTTVSAVNSINEVPT